MSALNRVPSLMARAGTASALTLAAVGGSIVVPGVASEAAAASPATKALKVAAAKKGAPYRWGATGPNRFDCSGLTQYAFKKAGKKLPRTAAQQYNKTRYISAKNRKAGDLVFFHSGSYVYHVGIYAGKGKLWHAPKTGDVVRLQKIWTGSVWYGRVK
ncbi:C40 family peptidase [Streptomyces sp. NPDC059515]|uniref:C40 family peptidase n=1 Tax=Streptomyces sp. NPDC059515 TaxID=3346854 RepID=UPI0036A270A0